MGAVSDAIAAEARAAGGDHHRAEVIAVRVKADASRASRSPTAPRCEADAVAGAVNPKLLYLEMLEPGALDPEFRSRIERWRCAREASA